MKGLIWHEKSFFALSGHVSTKLFRKPRATWTLHKLHKQEFGDIMGAEDIKLNEQTPGPMLVQKTTLAYFLPRILL